MLTLFYVDYRFAPFLTVVSSDTKHLADKFSVPVMESVLREILFLPFFVIVFIIVDDSHDKCQLTISKDITLPFWVK